MLEILDTPSPNFDGRSRPPDMVVLHYTGMLSAKAALDRLRDPAAEVSAHYLVDEDGGVLRLVPEARRAWHAGVSHWRGVSDVNAVSIGVELVNPGHDHGYPSFPHAQVGSLIRLLDDVRGRWSISDAKVVGHSDVAPGRKIDPGERFPWKEVAARGHGLWVDPAPSPGAPLARGDEGVGVFALQAGLTRLGYDCAPSGRYGAWTQTLVTAFQRHWRQGGVDGIADGDTRARLVALLKAAAAAD